MKRRTCSAAKLAAAVFFLFSVILPVGRMLFGLADTDIGKVFSGEKFQKALLNSVTVSLTATLISLLLAAALAFCIARTSIRGKAFFKTILVLPMLLPSISHGMGLIILFGANGILTRLFGLSTGLYGFWGIVAGSVMYSFPVAFLMLSDVLKYEDSTPYEAASVLGIPRVRRFQQITLPYLKKPLVSVIFATFTLIFTDYGVPLMIGGKYMTLPVMMYHEVIGRLDFGRGTVIGTVLLIPAIIAFAFDLLCRERLNSQFQTKPFDLKSGRAAKGAAYTLCTVTSVGVLTPLLSFIMLTLANRYPVDLSLSFRHIRNALEKGAGTYLANSVIISLGVAVAGICMAFLCAYLTARTGGRTVKALHLVSLLSLAVPGVVLGLSYVFFFKGSFIYGTLAILILVNLVHFFASPYLMMYNSLGKLNGNLEAVGQTLGIGRMRMIKDVILPQTVPTLLEMFTYFFVNSMITISAVSFLSDAYTKPLSLMITQFEAQLLLESSAFVSFLIFFVNLLVKGGVYFVRKSAEKYLSGKRCISSEDGKAERREPAFQRRGTEKV